jgi:hypothetical protein
MLVPFGACTSEALDGLCVLPGAGVSTGSASEQPASPTAAASATAVARRRVPERRRDEGRCIEYSNRLVTWATTTSSSMRAILWRSGRGLGGGTFGVVGKAHGVLHSVMGVAGGPR